MSQIELLVGRTGVASCNGTEKFLVQCINGTFLGRTKNQKFVIRAMVDSKITSYSTLAARAFLLTGRIRYNNDWCTVRIHYVSDTHFGHVSYTKSGYNQ